MQLSIIVPVYNIREYLWETIASVLSQNFRDFELILVDDGSTDGSEIICDEAAAKDSRVRVIHKANGGVSDARNVGVAAAQGEFIGFVDSDDLIEPNMYEELLRAQKLYDADVVQCRHDRMRQSTPVPSFDDSKAYVVNGTGFVEKMFQMHGGEYTNFVALWSKIYRHKCFQNIEFPVGRTFEDEQATYRICLNAERIVLLQEEYYHYIRREGSIITEESPRKMLDKQLALRDRFVDLKEKMPQFTDHTALSFYSWSTRILVRLYADHCSEYAQAKTLMLSYRKEILPYLDRYQAIYVRFFRVLEKWIVSNEFEPIQKWIRRVRYGR